MRRIGRRVRGLGWQRLKRHFIIAGAAVVLIGCRITLRFVPFPALRRLLVFITPVKLETNTSGSDPDWAAWAVRTASCYLNSNCLSQALAAYILMASRRHPAQLRVGVRKGEHGRLEAHAWVESAGRIIIGQRRDLSGYTPLLSVPTGFNPETLAAPASR